MDQLLDQNMPESDQQNMADGEFFRGSKLNLYRRQANKVLRSGKR
jgi:hypothetical protein